MKCKICKGLGVLEIEDDSEYDEGFCDCGNCNGTGVAPVKKENANSEYNELGEVRDIVMAWEQYKKSNWYESESIDVEKMLIDSFVKLCEYRLKHFA